MKYLSEYREPKLAKELLQEIKNTVTRSWKIMEICGGQTHSLVKNGLIELLPKEIEMIHGPGCPVCVTPLHLIDKAVFLALEKNVILCSYGDMLRVPGSKYSLLEAKAKDADIKILYSPLEAVQIAKDNPDRQVVFFAVGFETTAPANALSVIHAQRASLDNYSILASHVLVPPAIKVLMQDVESNIDAFLAAGHVCTIMGTEEYYPLVDAYKIPIVITGFEPIDLLQGILMVVRQLENKSAKLENQYARVVKEKGNNKAKEIIHEVFEITDRLWRGMSVIPLSGYRVKDKYATYDATKKFTLNIPEAKENKLCVAGDIMKGVKKPFDCPEFNKKCKPTNPLGAPMVSSEGACAAYFHYSGLTE